MASNIFTKIAQAGQALGAITTDNVNRAREWFRQAASKLKGINANEIMNSDQARLFGSKLIGIKQIGSMLLFFYDAKTKATLPYYDKFPLVFPIEIYKDGFLGINMHYLPPLHRARLMDQLYTEVTGKDEKRRLKISYSILKANSRFNAFKPCVKRYLYTHVRSRYYIVLPNEWDMVLMLPSERFVAGGKSKQPIDSNYSKQKVWSDSIKRFNTQKPRGRKKK